MLLFLSLGHSACAICVGVSNARVVIIVIILIIICVVITCVASHHSTVTTFPSATPSTDYTPQPQHGYVLQLLKVTPPKRSKVTLPSLSMAMFSNFLRLPHPNVARLPSPASAWLCSPASPRLPYTQSQRGYPPSLRLPTLSKVLTLPKFTLPSLRLHICNHAA